MSNPEPGSAKDPIMLAIKKAFPGKTPFYQTRAIPPDTLYGWTEEIDHPIDEDGNTEKRTIFVFTRDTAGASAEEVVTALIANERLYGVMIADKV